jgi:hypothetical protein
MKLRTLLGLLASGRLGQLWRLARNIEPGYYFPWQSRVELLRRLRGFLKPRGGLLVTTSCQSEHPTLAVLNLWATMTESGGRHPTPDEMQQQLRAAVHGHPAAKVDSWRKRAGLYRIPLSANDARAPLVRIQSRR